MSVKTKTKKPNKLNKTIFDAYEKAINNRMKAGHDVTKMTSRLNYLLSEYKNN
jgi:hypothetical protein